MVTRGAFRECKYGLAAGLLVLCLSVFPARQAQAMAIGACETSILANEALDLLADDIVNIVNDFIQELANFIDYDLEQSATTEFQIRLDEYKRALYQPLQQWWFVTMTSLQEMTTQLSLLKVDQTMRIGAFIDARQLNEKVRQRQEAEYSAFRRYTPPDTLSACQQASLGDGQTKAYYMSRALARTFAMEDTKRRNNYLRHPREYVDNAGSDLFVKKAHAGFGEVKNAKSMQILELWDKYKERYCEPVLGEEGCEGVVGSQVQKALDEETRPLVWDDIPAFLWDTSQTVDLGDEDTRQTAEDALRLLIFPWTPEPIPERVLDTPDGKREKMGRDALNARVNAIHHAVSQMMSEHFGGSGEDTEPLQAATGIPENSDRINSSYAEIRAAMGRGRVLTRDYITRLVSNPDAISRERASVRAVQSQLINDLAKRIEEMLWLESAAYSQELDALTQFFNSADPRPITGEGHPAIPAAGPAIPGTPYPTGGSGPGGAPAYAAPGGPPGSVGTNPLGTTTTPPPGPGGAPAGAITDFVVPEDQVRAIAQVGPADPVTEKASVNYACPHYIVLHDTVGLGAEQQVFVLSGPKDRTVSGVPVSVHYVVGKDGRIFPIVPENMQANHGGSGLWEGRNGLILAFTTLGIEIENKGQGKEEYPPEQINSVGLLVRDIMARHGIPKQNVIAHADMSLPPTNKVDVGFKFPWATLAAWDAALYLSFDPNEVLPTDPEPETTANITALLDQFGYTMASGRTFDSAFTRFNLRFDRRAFAGEFTRGGWKMPPTLRARRFLEDLLAQKIPPPAPPPPVLATMRSSHCPFSF